MKTRWVLVGAIALMAEEAHVSQVHYDGVELKDVVTSATVIVVAEPATPPRRVEEVDITPGGAKRDAERFPPYHRVILRYVVREVLRGADAAIKPAAIIEVTDADDATQEHIHRLYYAEKISKSPIYQRYQAAPLPAGHADPRRLLFLEPDSRKPGRLRFKVDGALEHLGRRAEVDALLAPPTSAP